MTLDNGHLNIIYLVMGIVGVIAGIVGVVRQVQDRRQRMWWILGFVLLFFVLLKCSWTPGVTANCKGQYQQLVYDDGEPDPDRYVSVNTVTDLAGRDIKSIRMNMLERLLQQGDDSLRSAGVQPFAKLLIPFLNDNNELNKAVIRNARLYFDVYIRESLDSATCRYSLGISLDKKGATHVNKLIGLAKSSICLGQVIDEMVMPELRGKGSVSVSLMGILQHLCTKCSTNPLVIEWKKECQDPNGNCDGLYFEKSGYNISLLTASMLNSISIRLQKDSTDRLNIVFNGYTDPTPVRSINYNSSACEADTGITLPNSRISCTPIRVINDNNQLSFARAYACYDFIRKSLYKRSMRLSYTGHGVSPSTGNEATQRTVTISISRY